MFFFSSRRRHTRWPRDWSSDVCSSDLNDEDKAVSSPDCLHQDGEPFTFAHLIERKNVKGGTNVIGIPEVRGKQPDEVDEKDLHEVFEISKPLESYGVDDSAVSHYVGPEDGAAVRSVILIEDRK